MQTENLEKDGLTEKEIRNIEILRILKKYGPISRPDIGKEMGINVVTIAHYIDDFIRHNLVHEKELDISEGGRRPVLLDLNPKAGYAIGVGLNLVNMVGVLVDLKDNIVFKTQVNHRRVSVVEMVNSILEIIGEIIRRSKDYTKDIKGIGVGIAGIVDNKSGSVRWPQRINHSHTDYVSVSSRLGSLLQQEFGLPVIIENDATAACFGEYWLKAEPDLKNIIYMFSGVGCGIVINGRLYDGSSGCAGEPSIHNSQQDGLFNCALGGPCFLKRWDTDLGIIEEIKSKLAKDKEGQERFFKLTATDINNLNLRSVFVAGKAKDPLASSVLDIAAQRLGIKIAYLVNLLNPQLVIIGGGLEEAGEGFLNKVDLTVREWAFREATEDLKIVYSALRENAVALGAAGLVTQKVFARLL